VIARARANSGALWLLAATTIANVLGFGYQLVMARLLTAEQYAILIALFGILILESISSQVIQSATAKLTAQYRARGDEAALHQFVRRWSLRVAIAMAGLALAIVALSGLISQALVLPGLAVIFLGVGLFFAGMMTFALGLLQGLARFGWMGSVLIVQAGTRLVIGVALVLLGLGVNGAFAGATAAIAVSVIVAAIPLAPLKGLFRIMWIGFAMNALTGILLVFAYPTKTLTNWDFYAKLTIIGFAVWVMWISAVLEFLQVC